MIHKCNQSIKKLLVFSTARNSPIIICGVVLAVLAGLIPPVSSILIGRIFNLLVSYDKHSSLQDYIKAAAQSCFSLLALGVANFLVSWAMLYVWLYNGEVQAARARELVFNTYMGKLFLWYDQNPQTLGDLTQLGRSFEEFRGGISESAAFTIQLLVTVLACICVSFYYSAILTVVIMASFPVIAFVSTVLGSMVLKYQVQENLASAKASEALTWLLRSFKFIKVSLALEIELQKFGEVAKSSSDAFMRTNIYSSLHGGLLRFLLLMIFFQASWFGSHLVRKGKLNSGTVMVCISACLILAESFSTMTSYVLHVKKAMVAGKMLVEFVDKDVEMQQIVLPESSENDIVFKNVSFGYSDRNLCLDNVSFGFPSEQFTYIIGKSGSGKSTIANLVMKFYSYSGSIMIGKHSVEHLSEDWLAKNITLVQQSSILFHDTLKNNITLGSDKDIKEVIEISGVSDFVSDLSHGLDTMIGQHGLSVSGGQQQRIALARALLKDSSILILDEAFSALDKPTRSQVLQKVETFRRGKTTIFITHEYTDIVQSSNVIQLNNGKVLPVKHMGVTQDTDVDADIEPPASRLWLFSVEENQPGLKISIFRLLVLMRKHVNNDWLLGSGILLAILNGVSMPLFSYFLAKVINGIIPQNNVDSKNNLKWSLIVLLVISMEGVTTTLKSYSINQLSEKWILYLRNTVFKKFTTQKSQWFNDSSSKHPEIVATVVNDLRDLRALVFCVLATSSSIAIMTLLSLTWAMVVGWKLCLVGLAVVIFFSFPVFCFSGMLQNQEVVYKQAVSDLENNVNDFVTGIKTIKAVDATLFVHDKFQEKLSNVMAKGACRAVVSSAGISVSSMFSFSAQAVLLFYGLVLVKTHDYSSGQLFQVYSLLVFTIVMIVFLIAQMPEIARGQMVGARILKLLDLESNQVQAKNVPFENGTIHFKNVSYSYHNDTIFALKKVNLKIHRGDCVAIVGESGSGKSTIGNLISSLYSVSNGSVTIGNTNISDFGQQDFYNNVAVVLQKPVFFHGSILSNLTYGLPDYNKTIIMAALKLLDLHEFINQLPHGINTMVGGDTNSVSGGEAQRLSIVRAILRRPKILIMDECTSALDPKNSAKVRKFITNYLATGHSPVTTILITHSPEIINIAGSKIELKHGRVVYQNK